MPNLQNLRKCGDSVIDTFSESYSLPGPPDGFDMDKFTRGRKFFQDNVFACGLSMLMSLITGLSVNNLLEPLVLTGQSGSPSKAFERYVRTYQHVLLWHFGNVWDPSSEAHKSITKVRVMHNVVREQIMKRENGQILRVTQYDMSLVQCGFIGAIIMYPDVTGIQYTTEDLSDYCYFWYGIGYLLGISDENNICHGGLLESLNTCKEIETDILLPALRNPPDDFYPMAEALIEGLNLYLLQLPRLCPLFSLKAILAILYSAMQAEYPRRLSLVDYLRILIFRAVVVLVRCVPLCRFLLNRIVATYFSYSGKK